MDVQIITNFFMWCTIINGSILLFWAVFIMCAPDWVYQTQTRWISISREAFDVAIYAFLGIFKVFFLMFNLAPYLSLLLIG
jgi:uncharacterized protein DUF6868